MSEKEIIIVEDLEYKEVTCADCEEPLLNLLRKSVSLNSKEIFADNLIIYLALILFLG